MKLGHFCGEGVHTLGASLTQESGCSNVSVNNCNHHTWLFSGQMTYIYAGYILFA